MVSALLLAAGESKRMGEVNKLLLPFDDKTMIQRVTDMLLDSIASEVIVITGHEDDKIIELLNQNKKIEKLNIVINSNYKKGMTTSIQEGIRSTNINSMGYMICLADMPLIRTEEFNKLINKFQIELVNNSKSIIIPTFNKKRGNPVIFSSYYKNDILNHKEPNGCKAIVKRNSNEVVNVEMNSNHINIDIDTLEEYEDVIEKK